MSQSDSYDSISIDGDTNANCKGLKHLPRWPPVNLEFDDITFSVEDDSNCK